MITSELAGTLTTLFTELVDGPPKGAYMLNQGDVGLLRSLDRLSAAAASASAQGGGPSPRTWSTCATACR